MTPGPLSEKLKVYYDLDASEDVPEFHRDDEAIEIAGVPMYGGGTNLRTWVRDLEFRYSTAKERDEAKERMKDAGFRFFP